MVDFSSKDLIPCPDICARIMESVASHMLPRASGSLFTWSPQAEPVLAEFKRQVAQAQRQLLGEAGLKSSALLTALAHAVGNVCALAVGLHMINQRVFLMISTNSGWHAQARDSLDALRLCRTNLDALARSLPMWNPQGTGVCGKHQAATGMHIGSDSEDPLVTVTRLLSDSKSHPGKMSSIVMYNLTLRLQCSSCLEEPDRDTPGSVTVCLCLSFADNLKKAGAGILDKQVFQISRAALRAAMTMHGEWVAMTDLTMIWPVFC